MSGFFRELAVSRLSWRHNAIRQVQDGVSYIRNFSPGGSWLALHGLQHLCGHYHKLPGIETLSSDQLLKQNDFLQGSLHAKVTPCDHNPIRCIDNLVQILQGLMILYFADNSDSSRIGLILLPQYLSDMLDICSVSGKRYGDEVNSVFKSKIYNIVLVVGIYGG